MWMFFFHRLKKPKPHTMSSIISLRILMMVSGDVFSFLPDFSSLFWCLAFKLIYFIDSKALWCFLDFTRRWPWNYVAQLYRDCLMADSDFTIPPVCKLYLDFRDIHSEMSNICILESVKWSKHFLPISGDPCHSAHSLRVVSQNLLEAFSVLLLLVAVVVVVMVLVVTVVVV